MTRHLKDRELEKKLNELSNGEFSKILDKSDMKNPNCICFTIDKKEDIELSVYLRPEAIEPEYDPHAWNNYPEVTPPEGVPMRVESKKFQNSKIVFTRECAIFRNGEWTHPEIGYPMVRKSCRFRPWED